METLELSAQSASNQRVPGQGQIISQNTNWTASLGITLEADLWSSYAHRCTLLYIHVYVGTHTHILAGNENFFCTFHTLCGMTIKHNDSCTFSWAFSLLFDFLIKLQ